jgi:predicted glycosyltransferase
MGRGGEGKVRDEVSSPYVFFSHDGYGVGHLRRNTLIARSILAADPTARITLVTGIPFRPSWLNGMASNVVAVPPLLKDATGVYRGLGMSFERAVTTRGEVFAELVRRQQPRAVIVDRHPYGTAGELRAGIELARQQGAAVVLGLRDILDSADVVATEMQGLGWAGVPELYDEVLVYGSRAFCDHEYEYGLPVSPTYCGWVAEQATPATVDPRLLVVAAGGGGDGSSVFRLGVGAVRLRPRWRAVLAAGPYADRSVLAVPRSSRRRIRVVTDVPGCASLLANAGAAVQMAGYNSTFEALAAGIRPILVPRTKPRREQWLRARRLAALGLADVVDAGAGPSSVARLLDGDRRLRSDAVAHAGIELNGATRAAARLMSMTYERVG